MFDLTGLMVMVVEDEFFIADEIVTALEASGAQVVGPAGSLQEAMALVAGGTPLDAAILDVNLLGELVFPVADSLTQKNIPFIFATGYDAEAIPERHRGVVRIEKPAAVPHILEALHAATSGRRE
jgi:CheY-like chemotaxis protein